MARSKPKVTERRRKAVTAALGVAGALSLATSASASTAPTGDIPTYEPTPVILAEEEISDVSLSTFYVFDKENDATLKAGVQTAYYRGCRCGGCARGCRCGWRGCGGCGGCGGCCLSWGRCRVC